MRRSQDYRDRVNRVLDHIAGHLDADLSLAKLSRVGCFSPFHFHRIFQGVTGETLNNHVRRVRLERAALLLRTAPSRRITDVAIETGFAGASEFSRAFKAHFGRTASSWDRRSPLEKSKISQAPAERPFHTEEDLRQWKAAKRIRVKVHRSGEFRYVYQRIFAPYSSTGLLDCYHALRGWLAERATDVRRVVFTGMSLDDPSITPAEMCRYDLGVGFPRTLPAAALPGRAECERRGFSVREFEPLDMVSLHCAGDIGDVDRAWHYLYRLWLPASGYDPANLPAMEMFLKLPEEIGWTTFDLNLCIPVVRL